ncbi:hypothetical protein OHB49_03010 [Streptomyces sp. NBC_01717]|uniref:hypothetical protein n=1 Tax=Streptomyces sp. NBC_01717 TaxID=2975918 RepID=UPI002E33F394|nr:hypothetical protein [Streptomyces sp. NBC_01717]
MQLQTPDEVRDFLRLCLDPGLGGKKRSVTQLALIMSDGLAASLTEHAPHLAELRDAVDRAEAAATEARANYTEGLRAWIADETTDRKDRG